MRRTSVALLVTLLAGLAGFAWIGWRSTAPTTQLVGPNVGRVTGEVVVGRVTGEVVVEGGAVVSNPASDIQPIRSAPVLVRGITTSGRRVLRHFPADRQGRFGVTLPPGRYTFTAVLYQGSIPLAQEPHATIRVPSRNQRRVEIVEHAE